MNKKREDVVLPEIKVNADLTKIEEIDESSDPQIKKPFDPTKIDMTLKPLIIDSLIKRMQSEPSRINLDTEFQRRGNLWDETAQSRLIESLLVRIPLPAFYFDGTDENNWKVVDGLQRLTTLKRFIIDKTLILQNLEFLKKFNGCGFDGLPLYLRTRIEETHITVYIINPGTPKDVKYNIFKRINTGGLMLTSQEIRHALNQGIPADFIKELADLPEFHKATHSYLKNHKRMEDRDFVTRFVSFYLEGYENYHSDLDEFLNDSMGKLKKLSDAERQQIKTDFSKAMNGSHQLFGEYAFRKLLKKDDRKHPLNKALFDTWSVNLARLPERELKNLIRKKDVVIDTFIELMNTNDDFVKAISAGTGKTNAVKTRFHEIKGLIKESLSS
ncbi:MAG: DUF262 domain-containing protein [Candidatus Aminicenantes bacterium]|nr:DUF262 domain-containing protein [Candidatus Aminicenantes bacterium]